MATASVKKIISEIERLDNAGKEAVRKHLATNGHGKSLTGGGKNGYNPRMSIVTKSPKTKPNGVGPRIAKRRRALGLSQEKLAERAGLTRVAVTRIESGNANPLNTTIRCIAIALETTASELLAGV